jgi:hypothetical protein
MEKTGHMSRVLILLILSGLAFSQDMPARPSSPESSATSSPARPSSADPSSANPSSVNPSSANVSEVDAPDAPDHALASLPDLLPARTGKPTLIGGTIHHLDLVRDRLTVRVFGGKEIAMFFDDRSHAYRDGSAIPTNALRNGDRVYVDTVLAGDDLFAQNIRALGQSTGGLSTGQIVDYDAGSGILTLTDALSSRGVRLLVNQDTKILDKDRAVSVAELKPGALISVKFAPERDGRAAAREVSILAVAGSDFYFSGRVAYLDLHNGIIVVVDPRDNKSYEVSLDPTHLPANLNEVHTGASVMVTANFNGTNYVARNILINSEPAK